MDKPTLRFKFAKVDFSKTGGRRSINADGVPVTEAKTGQVIDGLQFEEVEIPPDHPDYEKFAAMAESTKL